MKAAQIDNPFSVLASLIVVTVLISGCQRAYFNVMEKVGVHKRDILVDRVEDARDAQGRK